MNKPKMQGTAWESWVVAHFKARGIYARRLAEGGSLDRGDIEIVPLEGDSFVGECKATQTLNVTRVLGKAREKSGRGITTVLFWKRLTKLKPGQKKRRPDGEPIVVCMGLDTFDMLIDCYNKHS